MPRWHKSPEVLEAARRWRDRCLMADGSILSERRLWTIENLGDLLSHYEANFDSGQRDRFIDRLEQQLSMAPGQVTQLAAEVLWILYLSISHTARKGTTKRIAIRRVWGLSGEQPPRTSAELEVVLDRGVANPNPGFSNNEWREFVFCAQLVHAWKQLTPAEQALRIADPWAFADWTDNQPGGKQRQFRHMLLYLLFPEHFERIMAGGQKEQILRTFLPKFGRDPTQVNYGSPAAMDHALYEMRPQLEKYYDAPVVDYYEPPVSNDWDKGGRVPASVSKAEQSGDRANRSRGTETGRNRTNYWEKAYLAWEELADFAGTRSTVTYDTLGSLIGMHARTVQLALTPIHDYCLKHELPPLTILVVNKETRLPGAGFTAWPVEELEEGREEVFAFDWASYGNPFTFAASGARKEDLVAQLVSDPASAADVYATAKVRGGVQMLFRDALMEIYGETCCFSGSTIRKGLEAAHIVPWRHASQSERVDVRNGLLLTSWHHRLFDAGLLSLSEDYRIRVDPDLLASASDFDEAALGELDGRPIILPKHPGHRPDPKLIRQRQAIIPAPNQ